MIGKFDLRKIIIDHVQEKLPQSSPIEINKCIDFYLEISEFQTIQTIMTSKEFKHRRDEITLCTILLELLCNIIYDTLKYKKMPEVIRLP